MSVSRAVTVDGRVFWQMGNKKRSTGFSGTQAWNSVREPARKTNRRATEADLLCSRGWLRQLSPCCCLQLSPEGGAEGREVAGRQSVGPVGSDGRRRRTFLASPAACQLSGDSNRSSRPPERPKQPAVSGATTAARRARSCSAVLGRALGELPACSVLPRWSPVAC